MNEKIKELEKLAMVKVPHEMGGTYMAFSKEKFAELIVKECASICYKSGLQDSDAHALNLFVEFNIDGAKDWK